MLTTHPLHRPIYGAAQLDDDLLTVGVHADDTPARWALAPRGTLRHTTIVGAPKSGVSSLLRSILHGAHAAGIDADAAGADDVPAARTVLKQLHDLACARQAGDSGDSPLRLLVIDDLDALARDRRFVGRLTEFTRIAARTQVAVIAGTHEVSLSAFGGRYRDATLIRQSLSQELVLLRTATDGGPMLHAALRALGITPPGPIPDRFGDGSTTAGVGYLPRQSRVPFRAWLA